MKICRQKCKQDNTLTVAKLLKFFSEDGRTVSDVVQIRAIVKALNIPQEDWSNTTPGVYRDMYLVDCTGNLHLRVFIVGYWKTIYPEQV